MPDPNSLEPEPEYASQGGAKILNILAGILESSGKGPFSSLAGAVDKPAREKWHREVELPHDFKTLGITDPAMQQAWSMIPLESYPTFRDKVAEQRANPEGGTPELLRDIKTNAESLWTPPVLPAGGMVALPEGKEKYEKPPASKEPTNPVAQAGWAHLQSHPGDYAGAQKAMNDETQTQAAARSTGTLSVVNKTPLTRLGLVGFDAKSGQIAPNATGADADAGRVGPVILKTDVVRYHQAQTARKALDALDSTIKGALPESVGPRSMTGSAGRKLTDVVNPMRFARFHAAQLGAADAFIRAIANRSNQAQFKAAMDDIVGPNATVQSARAGIAQAKAVIDDIMTEFTGRADAARTGTEIPSLLRGGAEEAPTGEPPEDLEPVE